MLNNTVSRSVEFIKPFLTSRLGQSGIRPLIVGIEGPQGSGKTTSATDIKNTIQAQFPNCNIVQFSMDDFYVTFEAQQEINKRYPDNRLLQGRGLPGTHDIELLEDVFRKLIGNKTEEFPIHIPVYDKSQHGGLGDRLSCEQWIKVDKHVDLVIFEGWFNGYPSISNTKELIQTWEDIKTRLVGKFADVSVQNICDINTNLVEYQKLWELFDLFICIKTSRIENVYKWRLQQEHEMIKSKGKGMSDEEVIQFVDRYMPVYYLYYDRLTLTTSKIKSLELDIDLQRNLIKSNF